ncbi:MAG: hypothetical protein V4496_02385 [Pseudomonadota bacterium]
MRIQKNCAMALMLLTTLPLRALALLCEATVNWGEKNDSNYYAINYDCAHYTLFGSSRWCRTDSEYDPCPIPIESKIDCNSSTYVTIGNSTLSYLFPDALIAISEECKSNIFSA